MAGYGRGAFSGATSGIGQALGSLMLGDRAQQAGFDAETTAQTKMGQALALIQQAQANARLHDAQAGKAAEEAAVLQRRPGIADEVMAASSGVDVPTLNSYRTTQRTGQAPQVPMGPPDEMGGMGMGSAKFGPESSSRMGQALARLLPILNNEKDINPEQYAKAAGQYREQDLGDQVLAGTRQAGDVGRSQAAIAGKPLTAAHEYGVADLFGNTVDTSNPAAQRFGDYRVATTGAQKANARQSDASAAHSNAGTEKIKLETTQLRDAPKGKFDPASGMLIDERAGTARPVVGPDGQPMAKPDKPLPPASVKQLTEARDNAATIAQLSATFKPDFGGKGLLGMGGNLQLSVSGNMGADRGAVEWWKNYRKQAELVERHALFGAALTPTEQASWTSADIAPGMNPKVIETNLKTRAALAKRVFENARLDLIDAGNNEKRINAIAERGAPDATAAPEAPSAAPFTDTEKERRYQVWKAQQKAPT